MNHSLKKSSSIGHFIQDARGLSTVEYLILLVLIAVAGITVWGEFGTAVSEKLGTATESVNTLGNEASSP